jgi:hypothetical protein
MTKTTRPAKQIKRHTAEQVAAGWLAIERQGNGPVEIPASERVQIGSADSGFDLPPMI